MEKTYKFLQTTFLGLIAGVLIVLLLMLNYWANDIKITLRKSIVYQNNDYVKQNLEKYLKQRPSCKVPNTPKKRGI